MKMESVLDCVLPYIHDGDDLNSISLVSRKFYELDCITRKHLTVHLFFAKDPSSLSNRFPFIESLTLKGLPEWNYVPHILATPWIKGISLKFDCLKALHIRNLIVSDEDLELLSRTRGKDLRSLKICKCYGFSEKGLLHISQYCNDLTSLCLEDNGVEQDEQAWKADGEWLRVLALRNTPIESLHLKCEPYEIGIYDVEDLTLAAQKFSNSLVSLKIDDKPLYLVEDVLSHAINLQCFDGIYFDEDFDEDSDEDFDEDDERDYTSFKFPPSIRALTFRNLSTTSFSSLLPYVHQLRELHITCTNGKDRCQCFLIERCPNLEVLYTNDVCGDMGLRVISRVCKKLRKLTYDEDVTHMGLIAVVQGCTNLEYIDVRLVDISNEAFECVGTHLKNLCDFRMDLDWLKTKAGISITDLPLDNGIRAMLKGCIKLKRLYLDFSDKKGLTDVGLGYIGKYGINLRYLSLSRCKGVSDAGLLELSKGCPKLRKLYLWGCPFGEQAVATFVFNIHSLRYVLLDNDDRTVLALTRPTFTAEVLKKLQTLNKQLW